MLQRTTSALRSHITNRGLSRARWCCLLLGLLSPGLGYSQDTESPDEKPFPLPIEFQPYRVQLVISAGTDSPEVQREADRLQQELATLIPRAVGTLWDIEFPLSPQELTRPLTASTPPSAEESTGESPPSVPPEIDVVFQMQVQRDSGQVSVEVGADEPLWDHTSPRRSIVSADSRELSTLVLQELIDLFRPTAFWDRVDDQTVRLRVRGSGLAIPDPSLPLFRPDECFTLWAIYRNREGAIQRRVTIPWTMCRMSPETGDEGLAAVVSGLRSPLTSRPRGRVELWAVASRSQWPSTELELVTNSRPPRQLVAHAVRVSPLAPADSETHSDPESDTQQYLSNRRGTVAIPATEHGAPVWVAVLSGHQTLARIPLVPGAVNQLRLELPDDELRLLVEGQLQLLQGELVALVAERRALMVACRASAKRASWEEVDNYLQQLQALPTANLFRERVSGIRVPGIATARERKDSLTERRIARMCDETLELLQRHLTDEGLKLFQEEMTELKAASSDVIPK